MIILIIGCLLGSLLTYSFITNRRRLLNNLEIEGLNYLSEFCKVNKYITSIVTEDMRLKDKKPLIFDLTCGRWHQVLNTESQYYPEFIVWAKQQEFIK